MEYDKDYNSLAGPSRPVDVEQYDDALPFATLSPADLFRLQGTSSHLVIGNDGALYLRVSTATPDAAGSPPPRPTKTRRRKRLRSPSPPSLPRYPTSQHRSPPPPPPHYDVPPTRPRRTFSIFSLLCSPGLPYVIMVTAVAIAAIFIANTLYPITKGLGKVVDNLADFRPIDTLSTAIQAIPAKDIWCNGIGFGCEKPDRNAAFTTESFKSLDLASHPANQISLGNDFFDCLSDLRITREQSIAVSHLKTLATKVMQFKHVLEDPEELSANILALARARSDIITNANAARVSGSIGVGKVVEHFNNALWLTSIDTPHSHITTETLSGLTSAQSSLKETAAHTLSSSRSLKSADELSIIVSEQAHREMSRLRRINNEAEMGLKYLAYGWTEPSWKWIQPGLKGKKEDRKGAGEFLKELVRVVDETAQTLLVSSLSLQQCAANTKIFNEQLERAFKFDRLEVPLELQIQHLVPRMELLGAGLSEMKKQDSTLQLAGPTTTNQQGPPTIGASTGAESGQV